MKYTYEFTYDNNSKVILNVFAYEDALKQSNSNDIIINLNTIKQTLDSQSGVIPSRIQNVNISATLEEAQAEAEQYLNSDKDFINGVSEDIDQLSTLVSQKSDIIASQKYLLTADKTTAKTIFDLIGVDRSFFNNHFNTV